MEIWNILKLTNDEDLVTNNSNEGSQATTILRHTYCITIKSDYIWRHHQMRECWVQEKWWVRELTKTCKNELSNKLLTTFIHYFKRIFKVYQSLQGENGHRTGNTKFKPGIPGNNSFFKRQFNGLVYSFSTGKPLIRWPDVSLHFTHLPQIRGTKAFFPEQTNGARWCKTVDYAVNRDSRWF